MTEFATLTPALDPPAAWGFGDAVPAEVFAGMSDDALLSELELHERITAWLTGRGVAITESLARSREERALSDLEKRDPEASSRTRNLARAEARSGIAEEIALATGLPSSVARARVKLAIGDPVRHGRLRAALCAGEVSWQRAWHIVTRTQEAPPESIAGMVEAVIAPYPHRSVHGQGGMLVPHEIFTARLRRHLAKVTTPRERHDQAMTNRGTRATLFPEDGTGQYAITGHAGRIAGCHDRIDAIARRLRREGDTRPIGQLRSDIALDLLLYGQLPRPDQGGLFDPHTGTRRAPDQAAAAAGEAFGVYGTFGGELPPARVDVVISLESLMGASDAPGMVACGGTQDWLAARFVRDIAFAAGSTWRRLVTDPLTGYMVDLHVKGYTIGGDLRERIFARDRVSRTPGSMRPARACDIDHDIDYAAGGPSSESNASAKARRGHNYKTRRTWRAWREPKVHGDIIWTTGAQRIYVSTPFDYRDPEPPTVEQMRATRERECRHHEGLPVEEDFSHLRELADDAWLEHDLDLADPDPGPPRPPTDPGVELVGDLENWLAALLEDDAEQPPIHEKRPRRPEPPEPPKPSPWNDKDPGPPPF
ncbi:MAG: hypothetical protein Q4G43_13830 [Mobilicoccus sp.]|nr:hypothetical protein [Mobilicoccus sp.]